MRPQGIGERIWSNRKLGDVDSIVCDNSNDEEKEGLYTCYLAASDLDFDETIKELSASEGLDRFNLSMREQIDIFNEVANESRREFVVHGTTLPDLPDEAEKEVFSEEDPHEVRIILPTYTECTIDNSDKAGYEGSISCEQTIKPD